MHGTTLKATIVIAILVLTSCGVTLSSETGAEAATTKSPVPQGPITGKTAFWEMYKSARAWSSDIVPLSLESKEIPGIKNTEQAQAIAYWRPLAPPERAHRPSEAAPEPPVSSSASSRSLARCSTAGCHSEPPFAERRDRLSVPNQLKVANRLCRSNLSRSVRPPGL